LEFHEEAFAYIENKQYLFFIGEGSWNLSRSLAQEVSRVPPPSFEER